MNENQVVQPYLNCGALANDTMSRGTVYVEGQRAIAETLGKIEVAKRFPRDEIIARNKIMDICKNPEFAEKATYAYPKGKDTVSGASVYFARELARLWGNIEYGTKELSRDDSKSEMQAFAWDKESNTTIVKNFTNPHMNYVSSKAYTLTTPRDIYDSNANASGRRERACILAVIPSNIVSDALKECEKTKTGANAEALPARIQKMVYAFSAFGVKKEQIEKRLGHTVETISPEELGQLVSIYNSIKDDVSKPCEWFEVDTPEEKAEVTGLDALIRTEIAGKDDKNAK